MEEATRSGNGVLCLSKNSHVVLFTVVAVASRSNNELIMRFSKSLLMLDFSGEKTSWMPRPQPKVTEEIRGIKIT